MGAADAEDPAAVEYARYLGIEAHEDAAMMHIVREAMVADLPVGWEEHTDDEGNPYYFNEKEGRSVWEHPMDAHFKERVVEARRELGLQRPGKAAPGDRAVGGLQMPLEFSPGFPASSAVGQGSPPPLAPASATTAPAVADTVAEVKVGPPAAAAEDDAYLSAISNADARNWWAEQVGRKRVRTRQMAKVLAASLLAHQPAEDKAAALGPHSLAVADGSGADTVVGNSSTTRECARTLASAMETSKGKVTAEDFSVFVMDNLQGSFSPTALRRLARKLQPRRGGKRLQQASATDFGPDGTPMRTSGGGAGSPGGSVDADMRAFEMSRDSRASAVLERQRASPTAAKYGGSTASVMHRELLVPLTGGSPAFDGSVNSSPGMSSLGGSPAFSGGSPGMGGSPAFSSLGLGEQAPLPRQGGSPVRLPSLESPGHGGSGGDVGMSAVSTQLSPSLGGGGGGGGGPPGGPVLLGAGGQHWGGGMAGPSVSNAQRWPARNRFSQKRVRQRSEKLQPVGAGPSAAGGGAVGQTGHEEVSEIVYDSEEEGMDQAW